MASVTCRGDPLHMASAADLLARPCVDIFSKIQPPPAVTEIVENCLQSNPPREPSSSDIRLARMDPSGPNLPDSPSSPGHARGHSRPTSAANSIHNSRSVSRSTARSIPSSRHGSLRSTSRPTPNPGIVPVPQARTTPEEKRASLLALHRESCRLFQDDSLADQIQPLSSLHQAPSTAYRPGQAQARRSSEGASAPPSPIASSPSSRQLCEHRGSLSGATISPPPHHPRDRSNTLPANQPSPVYSPSASSLHIPTTVMEWTSPSTRRREYEKIDRASRGIRGLWRRVAPRWCQGRDSRTLFFEEGKYNREGSVRRFRMDLPSDDSDGDRHHDRFLNFRDKGGNESPAVLGI